MNDGSRNCRATLGQPHRILNRYSMIGLTKSPAGVGQHLYGWIPEPPFPNKGFSETKNTLTKAKGTPSCPRRHPALIAGLVGLHAGSFTRPIQLGSNAPLLEPVGRLWYCTIILTLKSNGLSTLKETSGAASVPKNRRS